MPNDRLIRPGQRKPRASVRPSLAGPANPIKDYIVPPSDARGRSVSISLSLPPQMRRVSSIVIQQHSLPFETEQDVMRWCLHHGLEILVRIAKDKKLTGEYSALSNWLAAAKEEQEALVYRKHLSRIFKTVEELMNEGHMGKAEHLADLVWRQSDRLEDPYWAEFYRATAKKYLDRVRAKVKDNGHSGHSGHSGRDR